MQVMPVIREEMVVVVVGAEAAVLGLQGRGLHAGYRAV
jgi:hypothetical protein